MPVFANKNKAGRIGRVMAYRTGNTKFQIALQIKVLSNIKELSAFYIGAYVYTGK